MTPRRGRSDSEFWSAKMLWRISQIGEEAGSTLNSH
jgi:hypothetical protein